MATRPWNPHVDGAISIPWKFARKGLRQAIRMGNAEMAKKWAVLFVRNAQWSEKVHAWDMKDKSFWGPFWAKKEVEWAEQRAQRAGTAHEDLDNFFAWLRTVEVA